MFSAPKRSPPQQMSAPLDPGERLGRVAALAERVARTDGLDRKIRVALELLDTALGHDHSMLLVPEGDERLVMLACRGYPEGGTGAELRIGEGPIGVAAARRLPVTLANVPIAFQLMRTVQERVSPGERHIELPGLVDVRSCIAVPAVVDDALVLVLYSEHAEAGRFSQLDEHVLRIVATELAVFVQGAPEDEPRAGEPAAEIPGPSKLAVRYYESDGSVFFDGEYVIKSLPGRILRRLLREYLATGRTEFTKKELRLDESLKLPPVRDNLDTRLILLRRRLEERFPFVRVEPCGRGRFRFAVQGEVTLEERDGP